MANEKAKMGRPIELAEPLASLAIRLNGIQGLRDRLGGISPSTIHRWSDKIRRGESLPPLVKRAIITLQSELEKEEACPAQKKTSSRSKPARKPRPKKPREVPPTPSSLG